MLKALWNSLGRTPVAETAAPAVDLERWALFAEHFTIGQKLRYYPEFREEIVFQTFVLAYRVNDKYLYSRDAVVMDSDGRPMGFRLADKKLLALAQIENFQLLLPDTSDMERTLDYFTRAELGRAGQFRQGNTITLFADTAERGIPTVDTKVDRRQTLKTGPYAETPTILVTPDFDTLLLADQRRKQRVQTDIGAELYLSADGDPFACVLGDFSETSMRLRVREDQPLMPAMASEQGVIVVFSFGSGNHASSYRIRGKLFRREDDFCVVQIEQLDKDGSFEPIRTMDILEIKTGLLNFYR